MYVQYLYYMIGSLKKIFVLIYVIITMASYQCGFLNSLCRGYVFYTCFKQTGNVYSE
jgi:hypothetical protein